MPRIITGEEGKRYGRLTVLSCDVRGRVRRFWLCRCDCGTEKIMDIHDIRKGGGTKSCGCLYLEKNSLHGATAGGKPSSEWLSWYSMKQRCMNPNTIGYPNYGGRGITICDRWLNSSADFLADMGPKPTPEHSIDRIDGEGNYEPSNCRWATPLEQGQNRRTTILVEIDGVTKSLSQWAIVSGAHRSTLEQRYHKGWRGQDLIAPARPRGRNLRCVKPSPPTVEPKRD